MFLFFIFFSELGLLQKRGLINTEVLLTVEDPRASVGSGGATLNALLVVAEHLGARDGLTVSTTIKPLNISCAKSPPPNSHVNVFRFVLQLSLHNPLKPGPRLNIKTILSTYGDFHVKDKTAVRTSYL